MKKIFFLCLVLFLLMACSSEKDNKAAPAAAAPATQTAAAPDASEPVTRLSGEYVLTQTDSKVIKAGDQEYTCQTTHTYTLEFIDDQTVRYTAKTDQSIDPPAEGVSCFAMLHNVDETGAYEIKDGEVIAMTFSPSESKRPWVYDNRMNLRLKNADTLTIPNNFSEFVRQ